METWQFVSPYVRRPLSFSSLLCSATFRAPGCQFPDMSLVLAWFVPKTEHVLSLEGCAFFLWALQDMLHFFAFLFLVAIARYVAFKLLGTIAFFCTIARYVAF